MNIAGEEMDHLAYVAAQMIAKIKVGYNNQPIVWFENVKKLKKNWVNFIGNEVVDSGYRDTQIKENWWKYTREVMINSMIAAERNCWFQPRKVMALPDDEISN